MRAAICRRPWWAILAMFVGVYLGVAFAMLSLVNFTPRQVIYGLTLAIWALSLGGVWPQDRDVDDAEMPRWTRVAHLMSLVPLGVLVADMLLPVPPVPATLLAAGALIFMLACGVRLSRAGRPLTNEMIDSEIAAGKTNSSTPLLSARPGRAGRVARIVVVCAGLVVALTFSGFVVAGSALAGPTQHPLRWAELPVHFCVETSGKGFVDDEYFVETVIWSFDEWGVPAVYDGECTDGVVRDNGRNEFGWGSLEGDLLGTTYWQPGSCGFFCNRDERHAIVEADVLIEPDPIDDYYEDAYCFDSVMLHEVGHVLGLQHLESPAVMSDADCTLDFTRGDIAALHERYGHRDEVFGGRSQEEFE